MNLPLMVLLCVLLLCSVLFFVHMYSDIRSLCRQLKEIGQGSHIELTTGSRLPALTALCRSLNEILTAKDRNHIQYEKAERQLKQDITNLAHDIRTPLTGAFGYVQLAAECSDPKTEKRYLNAAGARLRELEDMLEKLFLYTKLTGEDFAIHAADMKRIRVLPFLGDCLLSLYAEFEKLGSSPQVVFASEDFYVTAEEESLRRIFLNLIRNALTHGTGEITILQRRRSAEDLADSSAGLLIFENPIAGEIIPDTNRIFDRFYKADTARRKGSSGLGLFIVRELMRGMGGDVYAETEGTILRIVLSFPADTAALPRDPS